MSDTKLIGCRVRIERNLIEAHPQYNKYMHTYGTIEGVLDDEKYNYKVRMDIDDVELYWDIKEFRVLQHPSGQYLLF